MPKFKFCYYYEVRHFKEFDAENERAAMEMAEKEVDTRNYHPEDGWDIDCSDPGELEIREDYESIRD